MTTDASPAVADAIAAVAATWTTYADAPQTLTSARPDPTDLLGACAQLRAQMPEFDPATGTLPWETDPDLDPEAPEDPAWASAAFEVLYEMHVLTRTTPLTNQAHHLIELSNAVGDLTSWHPQYDENSGQIASATQS